MGRIGGACKPDRDGSDRPPKGFHVAVPGRRLGWPGDPESAA
jgi:hypothetical protein